MTPGAATSTEGGRVSVVIPLYNHERYIAEAVASVLDQGELLAELIVIDDGSGDGSAAVMADLAARDGRIRFLRQENRGAHATLNRGLALARGEFVAILNSDDSYLPGRLAALVRALDLDPGSDLAASSIAFMDGESRPIENPWFGEALDNYKARRDLGAALIDANFLMTTSNFLMRRSLPERIGGFAPLRYAHDLQFALRAVALGARLAFIDRPLLRYRFHGANTISEDHAKVRLEWALCAAAYLKLKQDGPLPLTPDRLAVIAGILRKHGLTRAAEVAGDALATTEAQRVDEALMTDAGFRAKMMAAV